MEKFFSDEELIAYLDGETDFAPVKEIEAALATDKSLAKRLEQLKIDKPSIAESFATLTPDQSFDPELIEIPPNQNTMMPWRMVASVAIVCLGLGFAMSSIANNTAEPDWKDYVAAYQALYTNSTLSHVNQTDQALTTELKRVSSAIGKEITLDQLSISDEVEYKRGQVLGYEGTALIQLAFLTSMGEPMALCILRSGAQETISATLSEMEGMSSAHWSAGGYSYLLIGGKDNALVSRLAEKYMSAKL